MNLFTSKGFPYHRGRRLRTSGYIRDLVSESYLTTDDLVMPYFIREEKDNPLFKNLYEEVSKKDSGYKNIGKQLRQMLPKVFDFKFKQDFWITKEANGKEYKTYHWERVSKTKEETNE